MDEKVLSLEELHALGNEGAPSEWLEHLTGEGIGDGFEGIHGAVIDSIMRDLPPLPQVIEATYEIAFPYGCNTANYTKGRQGNSVQYLVIHYTAGSQTAEGAARANCSYFSTGSRGASAHYFIDDGYTIMQSVPLADTAWHAGNWAINVRSIGIEVCTAGAFTENEIERLAWLVQKLMAEYDIPPDRVIRHYDANGKHCPAHYVDAARWNALHARITTPVVEAPIARPLQMYAPNGTEAQQFQIQWDDAREYIKLRNVRFDKVVDVSGAGKDNGTAVQLYDDNDTDAQWWKPIPVAGNWLPSQAAPIEFEPKCAPGKRLDVAGGEPANIENGAKLNIYDANGTEAQRFTVIDKGDRIWEILCNKGPHLAIDAPW